MKIARVLMLGLALGLASTQAHALVDVSAFGGYATVAMGDINNAINNSGGGTTTTDITNGFYVGADAGITLMPFLKIGPRLEYLQPGEGSVAFGGAKATIDTSLMMYDLGVTADFSLPLSGLSVQGGLWGGYGMANATVNPGGLFPGGTQTGTGSGFVGELAAQARYKLPMGLFLGADLGYLMANVTNMNKSNGQALVTTNAGAEANWDYSGLHAGGAVGWNF